MTSLDQSDLTRVRVTGRLNIRGRATGTLCLDCYDVFARAADRLGHQDAVTDIHLIRSRRAIASKCDRCGAEATS